ncbi:MAG: tRNA pseudouridine(55) synthase TruB [Cyclobacteriaceae bacterium]|nr:tRNA pseudouridine(55) synthase TruB [Cyclobacteriaceae bacterium]MCK5469756.1 tRNA pseudouridine(55) synthase TruB [Cyclobacteriaceae bacterium]
MNKYPAVEDGRMILINKELHWTSFDVVKKIRNLVRIKKVGHAGTLDPLATGLLIVCTGRMTKQINQFMNLEKEYTGTMVLGKTTPSVDLETEIDKETSIEHITEEDVINTAEKFTGNLMQTPPIYSALKKDGEPLYKKARKGENVKIEPRPVELKEFEITEINFPLIRFRLVCSKGFYVRSLVRDFGESLGVGAYMSSLERTRIGDFKIEDAQSIDEFRKELDIINS